MKAVVFTQYGPLDVLQLQDVLRPDPLADQVLIKVRASSINVLEDRSFEKLSTIGRFMEERFGKSVGNVLGARVAGVVEDVGARVNQFQPGDEVFGVSAGSKGGFAEYACAAENGLALKSSNLSLEAAAAVPVAGITALQGLRYKEQIQSRQVEITRFRPTSAL